MAQPNVAPILRHALPRGVYSKPYLNGRVYFYVTSNGAAGVWRLPMDHETPDDVIAALADALDVADPQRPSGRRASRHAPHAPHLRLLA